MKPKALLTLAALVLVPAATAHADPITIGDQVQMLSGPNRVAGFSGGEFAVRLGGQQFVSFCLEYIEHIATGSYYWVGDISAAAASGGPVSVDSGATGTSDPLDPRTAYLFTQARSGSYVPYLTNPLGLADSARELQRAIWHIEAEVLLANPWSNVFYADAMAAIAGSSPNHTAGAWSGLGDVRVLNLYTTRTEVATGQFVYSGFAQDQLTIASVPEPGSLLLLGTGLVGLGIIVRRTGKK